ncbi:uncharacterized protein BO88DRAFT_418034 [Aspergillus vadensis CBS 113365]|uniref:DUF7704 domain-containing protein n=1 Tax=Aspergillus vadensis (strain CBS 113365 / IMI 142717 / IBT 24658) TaxID=1448311 RepID=A0A319AZR0_ASPVC|nr:hypothetical protein BO88DRAFT_418034 [Aspergillus vadensis CBS 113365]PYH65866.1 hypothetical protein BO88DRAFT_418034 [Aspergillus vadensis CBS 113365]
MWLPLLVPGPTSIPYLYRLVLTIIEPMIALCGALQSLLYPAVYMSSMTRGEVSFLPEMEFLYTELGGAWLYFVFVEVVVLRAFDDEHLWCFFCAAMLLSDLAWCHSVAQAVGGWAIWLNICIWSMEDYFMFWTSAPITIMRLLIVSGIGLNEVKSSIQREEDSIMIPNDNGDQDTRDKEEDGQGPYTKG